MPKCYNFIIIIFEFKTVTTKSAFLPSNAEYSEILNWLPKYWSQNKNTTIIYRISWQLNKNSWILKILPYNHRHKLILCWNVQCANIFGITTSKKKKLNICFKMWKDANILLTILENSKHKYIRMQTHPILIDSLMTQYWIMNYIIKIYNCSWKSYYCSSI